MRHIIIVLSLFFCILTHAVERFTSADAAAVFPHDDWVSSVAFAPDGQHILTGSLDNTAVLWTLDGQKVQTFPHDKAVRSVAFAPDGQHILTGSDDNTAVLWTLDGQKVQTFPHDYPVLSVAFAPDGQHILTGSFDNTAILWTLDRQKVQMFSHDMPVNFVAFAPDGQHILTGSLDNTAVLWTLDGQKVQTFPHDKVVYSVAFTPDGQHILTGSFDNTAVLWTLNGQKVQTFQHDKEVTSVAFAPDGQSVLIGSGGNAYLYAITPFHFSAIPSAQNSRLTTGEVAVMARLGVKIRYDGEEKLHTLSANDAPAKVVQAVELNLANLFLDELPPWLGKFQQLRYLNLSQNPLKLASLAALFNLPQLENLDLSGNPIFKTTIGDGGLFTHLPNLIILNLSDTGLNDADWANLTLPKLLELDISANRLTQLNLSNQPRLRKVNASNNQIATLQLHDLNALEELNLNYNRLTTLNLSLLPDSLNSLRAENNQLHRIEFDRQHDRPQLEALYLTGNEKLILPESMGSTFVLPNLRVCNVDSSADIPKGLRRKLGSYQQGHH